MQNIHQHKILILDFGSQYTQLIARRVRQIGVYCELAPYDISIHFIENFNPSGIILSGGPDTVNDNNSTFSKHSFCNAFCIFFILTVILGQMVGQLVKKKSTR